MLPPRSRKVPAEDPLALARALSRLAGPPQKEVVATATALVETEDLATRGVATMVRLKRRIAETRRAGTKGQKQAFETLVQALEVTFPPAEARRLAEVIKETPGDKRPEIAEQIAASPESCKRPPSAALRRAALIC